MDRNYWIISLWLAWTIGQTMAAQSDIDTMSRCIQIEHQVVSNLDTPGFCHGNLYFSNVGCEDLDYSGWTLHFCHLPRFSEDAATGVDLGNSGFKVFWINGNFHKIEPTANFSGFPSGNRVEVPYVAFGFSISKSDVMPDWFFVDQDSEPRTVINTSGEDLEFVSDFTNPDQWKRSAEDTYDPYTAEERLAMLDYDDLGSNPALILPTPIQEDLDQDSKINIGSGDWVIVTENESLLWEAEYLAMRLDTVVQDNGVPASRYVILSLGDVTTGSEVIDENEAYRLNVDSDEIIAITGNDAAGVFYGIQSLLSMYDVSEEIPTGDVTDYPRFHYRGMHLDVSRNFRSKLEVFKLLESMSMYKLNKFHFHLTDDEGWRLEIPGLPELTEVGAHRCYDPEGDSCLLPQRGSGPGAANDGSGFYSVQDYQEILEFAKRRHIEVIPEFDMPGHCHAAINAMSARYRKYADDNITMATEYLLNDLNDTSQYASAQYFTDNAVNPCLDSTFTFIDHVIREVKFIHEGVQPLRTFHFGGDEVAEGAWLRSPACQTLVTPVKQETLMEAFVLRVADLAADRGLDLAGWEDGLMEGSIPFNRTFFPNNDVYGYVWNNIWEEGSGNRTYILANQGFKVILAHATHLYFDHPHEPDPDERGSYWATRISPARKVFGYMPDDVYGNMDVTGNGDPIDKDELCDQFGCPPLDGASKENVIGMQGHLWSERCREVEQLHYMVFPRLVALAERAWHKASWEEIENEADREAERTADWERFANALGYKELGRLDRLGVAYRVSPPGASLSDELRLAAKTEYPGSLIQYSVDGGATWSDYADDDLIPADTDVILVTRSADSSRVSRQVSLAGKRGPVDPEPSGVDSVASLYLLLMISLLVSITVLKNH